MELEGRKGLVGTGKSSGTWNVLTVPLRLAVVNVFQGFFVPKMAGFGPKLQLLKLRSTTCESGSRPQPQSFSPKLCVIVLHNHTPSCTKISTESKPPRWRFDFYTFARAAACLLFVAACFELLLNLAGPL